MMAQKNRKWRPTAVAVVGEAILDSTIDVEPTMTPELRPKIDEETPTETEETPTKIGEGNRR